MFETSVVQARAKAAARRPLLLTVSVGMHAAVIIGAVAASIATVSLPRQAPRQVTIPFFKEIPPMLGDGGPKKTTPAATPPQQTVKRAPATPPAVVAPTTVPDVVTPVAAQTSTADLGPLSNTATGPSTSDIGGPGVPWGSKDGIDIGQQSKPEPPPVVVRVAKAPVVLHRVVPPYPPLMQKIRLNGFVILDCIIDPTGHIREAHVVGSSNPAFEQAALDAVYQWQFQPGTMNGVPVDVQFELKVSFQIH